MKIKGDALFAMALFGIFSFGTYRSLVMDNPYGGPNDVGAAFFPFWVCVFIQVLCALVVGQSVLSARRAGGPSGDDAGVSVRRRTVLFSGILLLLFLYILMMETVGFIASSAVFLVLVHQLLVFSETGRPSPLKGLMISVGFFGVVSATLFFLFNTVFQLALP